MMTLTLRLKLLPSKEFHDISNDSCNDMVDKYVVDFIN